MFGKGEWPGIRIFWREIGWWRTKRRQLGGVYREEGDWAEERKSGRAEELNWGVLDFLL